MGYEILTTSGRRTGKTTALCKAAKEIGATVLTHNEQEADRLRREYGVDAKPLTPPERLMGLNKPLLVDSHAAAIALCSLTSELHKVTEERDALRAALEEITALGVGYDLSWSVDCEGADNFKKALGIARKAAGK